MKALASDPEDRYSNAIDLHDDLQAFLYSVGEFYSRKDLAAWMKKTFAMEIEEDNAKLEQYRQIAAPVAAGGEAPRRAAAGANAPSRFGAPPPVPPTAKNGGTAQMGWDDEELDTQIFDKEPDRSDAAEAAGEDRGGSVLRGRGSHRRDGAAARHPRAGARAQLAGDAQAGADALDHAGQRGRARAHAAAGREAKLPPRRPTLTGIPAPRGLAHRRPDPSRRFRRHLPRTPA